jgi:large subunit ribosomal protein L17
MRHRLSGKKLGRNTKQRKALYKGLLSQLIHHGEIITTLSKAKSISKLMDKLITKAKKQDLNSRRIIAAFFNKKSITNKLIDELAPQMGSRTSGYTKITRIGNRTGDDALTAKIEFIDKKPSLPTVPQKNKKDKSAPSPRSKKTTTGIQRTAQKITARGAAAHSTHKGATQRTTSK